MDCIESWVRKHSQSRSLIAEFPHTIGFKSEITGGFQCESVAFCQGLRLPSQTLDRWGGAAITVISAVMSQRMVVIRLIRCEVRVLNHEYPYLNSNGNKVQIDCEGEKAVSKQSRRDLYPYAGWCRQYSSPLRLRSVL